MINNRKHFSEWQLELIQYEFNALLNERDTLKKELETLKNRKPVAFMVYRDVGYESREYFDTEGEAQENACLGVATAHIYPLFGKG